jgi:hypothetical protein
MGDALELLGDGRFLLHGRKADLVNIAGKRTSLAYLNHQLNAIAGVVDGVFFMPDEAAPADADARREPVTRLVALVVAPTLAAADLQRALRERIDPVHASARVRRRVAAQRNGQAAARRAGRAGRPPRAHERGRRAGALRAADAARLHDRGRPSRAARPFPGHPIVPGVVLLDHAIAALGASLNRPLDTWRLASAKF